MIKNTINNNTTERNERQCTCKNPDCRRTLAKGDGVKIYTRNSYGFFCHECAIKMTGNYSTENSEKVNKATKTNDCTISIELEVPNLARCYTSEESLQWLTNEAKFLKTPDGSVWYEFKSPIYNNLLGLSKVLSNFEKLNKLSSWNESNDYGTHLNIGNEALTEDNLLIIRRFYHSLFVPYSYHLLSHPEKTIALHGRFFTYYAQAITDVSAVPNHFGGNYMEDCHCNFINIQHSTHIEFRLCKLMTARQYMMVARMYQEIIQKAVCDYFLARYDESMTTEKKKQLASKASEKMIKIFEKYYSKLINE